MIIDWQSYNGRRYRGSGLVFVNVFTAFGGVIPPTPPPGRYVGFIANVGTLMNR